MRTIYQQFFLLCHTFITPDQLKILSVQLYISVEIPIENNHHF